MPSFVRKDCIINLVNRGISIARRIYTACIIKLFINKDLKLKKRKGKERKGKGETGSNIRSYIQSLGYIKVI